MWWDAPFNTEKYKSHSLLPTPHTAKHDVTFRFHISFVSIYLTQIYSFFFANKQMNMDLMTRSTSVWYKSHSSLPRYGGCYML